MTDETKKSEENQQESSVHQAEAKEVTFADIEPGLQDEGNSQNMDFLLDIPLEIHVELGRTKIKIGNLLKMSQGSVVEWNSEGPK
ncbi:MAG: FliM/FliN family flagellar motor switch protein [Deltaproteobacteria bacterium]|nr:FliM/FliN family flagellar motor switch protein [Deltaproteobacteria bacterium]